MSASPARTASAADARPHRLRAVAVTIYATFAILGLAIPGAWVGALREASSTPLTRALLAVGEPLLSAIDAIGLTTPYRIAKERFREISCGPPDSGNPC